ncbi:DMT family transporter [Motiliproteus sp. MSK22-1]|uniref:DMT family transporter n=1 Tax=Motiliproteus sp. MSK22-1 TaxID=1897630 RepID=UPI0009F8F25F|nr:DMT family transporter [Motiliproteus sp. MSK22-1]
MNRQQFQIGFILISIAIICWGMLPIALKLSSTFIDPVTLTWFRFSVALVIAFFTQVLTGAVKQFANLSKKEWVILSACALFSIANYISFVYALDYIAPGPAQLNFQLAPFYLAIGGVLLLKERISRVQWLCFIALGIGLMLFFHPYLNFAEQKNGLIWVGIAWVQFSAMSWSGFALLQKSLFHKLSPANTLLFIYVVGLLVIAPFADFSAFEPMAEGDWYIAVFCAFNTVIAYTSFSIAMKYWPTAQVSAMVGITPLTCFAFSAIAVELGWWPEMITANNIDAISASGMIVVVLAVAGVQLLPRYSRQKAQPQQILVDKPQST